MGIVAALRDYPYGGQEATHYILELKMCSKNKAWNLELGLRVGS